MTTVAATPFVIAGPEASAVDFDLIAAFPPPGWQIPRAAAFSPDGQWVTYLQSESQSEEMALFAFDLRSREHRVLLRANDVVDPSRPMSRAEELRRERQRKRIAGVSSYAWAEHAPVMVLPLGGNVFVRAADGKIKQLTDTPEPEIDPQICADGSRVAFARGRELYLVDSSTGREQQLSRGAPEGVTRGQSDFNGQEELGEPSGLWWSPSCDRLAFFEVDQRQVASIPVLGYRGGSDLQMLRYPRAGATNPAVRLFVVDAGLNASPSTPRAITLPATDQERDGYLCRVRFSRDGQTLYFQHLHRSQRQLTLLRADAHGGEAAPIVHESDPHWLDPSAMKPLEDGSFLWLALRDGHRHLERRDGKTGAKLVTLTRGDWDVSSIVGVDQRHGRVLLVANRDEVLGRQLYAVPLAGGEIERLSQEAGVHAIAGTHPEHGWVDIHSAPDRLPQAIIHGPEGESIGEIGVPHAPGFDKLGLRPTERVTIERPGLPPLYGALLGPRKIEPGVRHPAVLMVYGGPAVQTIVDAYNPRPLWQHLADRGIVVMQVDGRGAAGRGHAYETPIDRRLGETELGDQLAALDYLSALPYVDATRVGIYGHSYGGYMAAMAMLRAPGRFEVGVSGSPVSDWRFYDSGYTERYMGTPENNAEGYRASELAPFAHNLKGKLLIIHALMDENVHFAHTAKLIDALVAADKDFDLLVFPGERHGYRSPAARRYAFRRVIAYLAANL